jgi:hypothetical protein
MPRQVIAIRFIGLILGSNPFSKKLKEIRVYQRDSRASTLFWCPFVSIRGWTKNLKKSIDTLLRVQLKGALSPA